MIPAATLNHLMRSRPGAAMATFLSQINRSALVERVGRRSGSCRLIAADSPA